MAKIKDVTFIGGGWDPVEVKAEFDDGTTDTIFDFFDDELSFSREELIGLTREEAIDLRYKRDLAYLRS